MFIKYSIYISLVISLLIVPGCGGGGGGDDLSNLTAAEQEAYNNAADAGETFNLQVSSGSVDGFVNSMATAFPGVTTLIDGGADVRTALELKFSGTKTYENDMQLAIFAYALAEIGNADTLSTLRDFLGDNLTSGLPWSPHLIARAIETLSGETDLEPTSYYNLPQLIQLTTSSDADVSAEMLKTDFGDRDDCVRRYMFVDGSGNPITYEDAEGVTQIAYIEGREVQDATVRDAWANDYIDRVIYGGGDYVDDEDEIEEFVGTPSMQFNCGGYAFRGFHDNLRWRVDPAPVYEVLIRTGLITEVSQYTADEGDMVFYFTSGSDRPGHVAEIHQIDGYLFRDITVRNADGPSGLFDAPMDADYFTPEGEILGQFGDWNIYEWTSGSAPSVEEVEGDNETYCNYVAPSDGGGGGSSSFDFSGEVEEATFCMAAAINRCADGETNSADCTGGGTASCTQSGASIQLSFSSCWEAAYSCFGSLSGTVSGSDILVTGDLVKGQNTCTFTYNAVPFSSYGAPQSGTADVDCGDNGTSTCTFPDNTCN